MVDRKTRCILGWAVVWIRTQAALQQVVDEAPKAKWYYSDGLEAYQWLWYHFGRYEISKGKADTYSVEADNAELRHYLARLARKSRCFSRCPYALECALPLFVYSFNSRQLHKQHFPKYVAHLIDFVSPLYETLPWINSLALKKSMHSDNIIPATDKPRTANSSMPNGPVRRVRQMIGSPNPAIRNNNAKSMTPTMSTTPGQPRRSVSVVNAAKITNVVSGGDMAVPCESGMGSYQPMLRNTKSSGSYSILIRLPGLYTCYANDAIP